MKQKFQFKDFTAEAAARKPSPKAVQKANETLKAADKAKSDEAKTKLQDGISAALEVHTAMLADEKLLGAQMNKIDAQMRRLQSKLNRVKEKAHKQLFRLGKNIDKLQSSYTNLGGKNLIPDDLLGFVGEVEAPADLKDATARRAAVDKALGIGAGLPKTKSTKKVVKTKTKTSIK